MMRIVLGAAAALAAAAAPAAIPPAYQAHLPEERRIGEVAFRTGGDTREEELALKRAAQEYPLELVFLEKRGESQAGLDGMPVTITDVRGQVVLDSRSEGPIFLARLPAGRYFVTTKWQDWEFTREVELGEEPERVVFSWKRATGTG